VEQKGANRRTPDGGPLLSASDLARFCQVDLKTVHNWVERGLVRHFRTPGRHIRVRRQDAVDFLRRYGYPLPQELSGDRATVVVSLADSGLLGAVKKALGRRFDVVYCQDPVDGLVVLGEIHPAALLLDLDAAGVDGEHVIGRLRQLESTRHVVVVAVSAHEERRTAAVSRGAHAATAHGDFGDLRDVLERLLATE
jgi:CheY-like chemotaxis protein